MRDANQMHMEKIENAAYWYLEHGFGVVPCCFPIPDGREPGVASCRNHGETCNQPGKRPLISQWNQRPFLIREDIHLWAIRGEAWNVAVLNRAEAGQLVVDVDYRNGGEESIKTLIKELGPLPVCCMSISGGGYKLHLSNLKLKIRGKHVLAPGIDILGYETSIVMPPSLHHTGVVYRWARNEIPEIGSLPDFPDKWAEKIAALDHGGSNANSAKLATLSGALVSCSTLDDLARVLHISVEKLEKSHLALANALCAIPAGRYKEWLEVGMALHNEGATRNSSEVTSRLWDSWAQTSPAKFDAADQRRKWDGFRERGNHTGTITIGTVYHFARQYGWKGKPVQDGGVPIVLMPGGVVRVNDAGAQLGASLNSTQRVFMRGGVPVELRMDGGACSMNISLEQIDPTRGPSLFEEVAELRKIDGRNGQETPTCCTIQQAKTVLAASSFRDQLPNIRVITNCPVLMARTDGTLDVVAEYDETSGVYANGKYPPEYTLDEAVQMLEGLLEDFDFENTGDRARAMGSIIGPGLKMGNLVSGRFPVDVTKADKPQSGKGFRNKLVAAVYADIPVAVNMVGRGVGSMEESFDAALCAGKYFINLDNVRGRLNSQKLESFLTEDSYMARQPYARPVGVNPDTVYVMMTSNSADLTSDMIARCSFTQIRKRPKNYRFRQYNGCDILTHVRQHQLEYLGAVFTIIGEWWRKGRPQLDDVPHSFREWGGSVGYIVENIIGQRGFFDNLEQISRRVANPHLVWMREIGDIMLQHASGPKFPTTVATDSYQATDILNILVDEAPHFLNALTNGWDPVRDTDGLKNAQLGLGRKFAAAFEGRYELTIDDVRVSRQCKLVPKQGGNGTHQVWRYWFERISTTTAKT